MSKRFDGSPPTSALTEQTPSQTEGALQVRCAQSPRLPTSLSDTRRQDGGGNGRVFPRCRVNSRDPTCCAKPLFRSDATASGLETCVRTAPIRLSASCTHPGFLV